MTKRKNSSRAENGAGRKIDGKKMTCGFKDRTDASAFYDANGNFVSANQVMLEVDRGYRDFWARRGRTQPASTLS